MARALIVACGCRGRELAAGLVEAGWLVRGTTRSPASLAAIEDAGAEAALADPDRIGTVVDHLEGVAAIYWLLGSARGAESEVSALHGPRLERLLEEVVDTPVRGFVYEGAGDVPAAVLARGADAVRAAAARWRIPAVLTGTHPTRLASWRREMLAAAVRLTGG